MYCKIAGEHHDTMQIISLHQLCYY